jgi:hypothetical protein
LIRRKKIKPFDGRSLRENKEVNPNKIPTENPFGI